MKTKLYKNPLILSIISGLLLILCFPPFNLHFLVWVALVPYLYVIYTTKFEQKQLLFLVYRPASLYGLVFGAVVYYGTLYWFLNVFGVVGVMILLILPIVILFQSLILNYVLIKLNNPLIQIFFPAILWTAIEFLRSECWWFKFTWIGLGYSQSSFLPILQLASIFGIYGISFLIVLVNTLLVLILLKATSYKFRVRNLVGIILIFVFTLGFGYHKLNNSYESNIKVALVQNESSNFEDNFDLTDSIKEDVDVILWPEYSVPYFLFDSPEYLSGINYLVQSKSSYLIIGSQARAEFDTRSGFYNTAFVFDKEGNLAGKYVKMNPIQFFQDGVAGKEYTVIKTDFGKIGIVICYDLDYSYVARNIVKNGAQMLFVPTFDKISWGEIQHKQHSAMTAMRAVENGVFISRAASSGFSQIIDPQGRVINKLDFAKRGILFGEIQVMKTKTFYTQYGYLFSQICVVLGIGLLLYTIYLDKYKKMI